MNSERKPVNVLDVMDQDANEAAFSRRRGSSPYADELKKDSEEARAIVAELIEAAQEAADAMPKVPERLRAALARVGGAS